MNTDLTTKDQQTSSELMKQIPVLELDLNSLQETLDENLGTGALSTFNLPRIRIEKFGFLTQDADGETMVPTFRAVILHHQPQRAYWPEPLRQGESRPPSCHSMDGKIGIGSPGGKCVECPMAEYGSARTPDGKPGRGQACKQTEPLFLFREGNNSIIPEALNLPPTSLRNWNNFVKNAGGRIIQGQLVPLSRYLVEFSTDNVGTGSMSYSKVAFKIAKLMPMDVYARINTLRNMFKPLFEATTAALNNDDYTQPAASEDGGAF